MQFGEETYLVKTARSLFAYDVSCKFISSTPPLPEEMSETSTHDI